MGYIVARWLVELLFRFFVRVEVQGIERIPQSGSCVIVSNHLGRLDAPLGYYLLNRRDVIVMAAEKYRENAIFRWFARQFNVIWVDRFNADFSAMRAALQRLKRGEALILAPEGTRSPTCTLQAGRPGASYLAAKAGVPLIPVALVGSEDSMVKARIRRLQRPHVRVYVGQPFMLPPLTGSSRDAVLEGYTDEIMCRIAALLPPDYRGVYTGHSRLQELLEPAPV